MLHWYLYHSNSLTGHLNDIKSGIKHWSVRKIIYSRVLRCSMIQNGVTFNTKRSWCIIFLLHHNHIKEQHIIIFIHFWLLYSCIKPVPLIAYIKAATNSWNLAHLSLFPVELYNLSVLTVIKVLTVKTPSMNIEIIHLFTETSYHWVKVFFINNHTFLNQLY